MFSLDELFKHYVQTMQWGEQLKITSKVNNYIGSKILNYPETKNLVNELGYDKALLFLVQESKNVLDYYNLNQELKDKAEIGISLIKEKEFKYGDKRECK